MSPVATTTAATATAGAAAARVVPRWTGSTRYALRATVSHMGRSTHSGHYVCHARRHVSTTGEFNATATDATAAAADGAQWLLLNDALVTACPVVPLELAYVYVYERLDD